MQGDHPDDDTNNKDGSHEVEWDTDNFEQVHIEIGMTHSSVLQDLQEKITF